jgi:hypothetical protein
MNPFSLFSSSNFRTHLRKILKPMNTLLVYLVVVFALFRCVFGMPGKHEDHLRRQREAKTSLPEHLEKSEQVERRRFHWEVFSRHFTREFYENRLAVDFSTLSRFNWRLPDPVTHRTFTTGMYSFTL